MALKVVKLDGQIFSDPHWHFEALMRGVQTVAPEGVNLVAWAETMVAGGLIEYGYKEGDHYDWRGKMT